MAAPFRIYSTLSRQVSDFKPLREGHVGLYVCGMTVYDRPHVGHGMANIIFDSFVRYLRYRGWDVTFVRNFTDVDDKIIARAAELGEEPAALAQRYIDAFQEDADALGMIRPDHEPRVTESIEAIKSMVQGLVDKGHAYENEGTVWFDVKSLPTYGKLSGQKVDELRSPDSVPGKRHPSDFALWKAVKPGEPSWESAWGPGRPGWHIECSAMSVRLLGENFDIHAGGLDLVFPHHENEVAQSEGHSGGTYANYWMHNGLLTMASGKKMGKSLGNMVSIQGALEAFPAETLRLYYLQNHYRSPLPWGEEALPEALAMLCRLYEAKEVAEAMGGEEDAAQVAQDLGEDAEALLELASRFAERFHRALDDDFNTALALGHVFELVRVLNRFSNHKKAKKRGGPVVASALEALALVPEALGLLGMDVEDFMEEVKTKRLSAMELTREDVEAKITARAQARTDKDWAQADALRQELDEMQIVLMDGAEGTSWRIQIG
jgi:cysteinyl-tRNA synthetase